MSTYFPDSYFDSIKQIIDRISELTRPVIEMNNAALVSAKALSEKMAKITEPTIGLALKMSESVSPLAEQIVNLSRPSIELSQKLSESVFPLAEQMKRITLSLPKIVSPFAEIERNYMKSVAESLSISSSAMRAAFDVNMSGISELLSSLPDYKTILDSLDFGSDVSFDGSEFTEQDIADEVEDILKNKRFSILDTWSSIQKKKWFIAIRIIIAIAFFVAAPAIDRAKEDFYEVTGINDFWEECGAYKWLDSFFNVNNETVVTEEEAKESVDMNNTGNISKQKREDLLAKIGSIREFISAAPQDENTTRLLAYLSDLAKDVNGKKYGLVFEEHREEIDEVLDTHTPVLAEDTDLFIDNGGQMNFLIEGDNLASLKLLEKTHKEKIDLIYIDPPYNTGGTDFRYDDTIIAKEDSFRHSKWISFMKQRLKIAQKLLSDDGVIFISIDENEQAALKLLCDEIFSAENHIETIIWKNKYGAGAKTVGFISVHEYILCYSKKPIVDLTSELDKEGQAAYKKIDEKFDERGGYLTQPLMTTSLADRPNLVYDIEYNGDIIHPRKQWVWSRERLELAIQNNEVEFNKQKDGTYSVRAKKYLFDEKGNIRRGKPISILNGPFTQDGTKEIRDYFGSEDTFKFSKPSELIKYLVAFEINGKKLKDSTILDFFAGSGTTAQSVLAQNKKDGGTRNFILCTNNENNICRDVTYERIKRVIDKEGYTASLKYYKVEYIPISDRMYYEYADELLLHIRELVELENGINFIGNAEIAIVLTDEELAEFVDEITDKTVCRKLYMGHDILPDEEQQEILTSHGIEVSIIPDYYYHDLQED